ncbi:MAG: NAD(P)/FAD-dependent oxidoreductase, partial [Terriglobales bacterium]
LDQVFARHPQLWRRSRDWTQTSETAATSPLLFRAPAPLRGGLLCAGDAAGFIDPFAGDGISLALHSGALAAASVATLWRAPASSPADAAAAYSMAWERAFSRAFRNASLLRRLSTCSRPLRRIALRALASRGTRRCLVAATRARLG